MAQTKLGDDRVFTSGETTSELTSESSSKNSSEKLLGGATAGAFQALHCELSPLVGVEIEPRARSFFLAHRTCPTLRRASA